MPKITPMNFLAHLYLSPENEHFQLGNFVADAIKGKNTAILSKPFADGVNMHHQIDAFTDHHPLNTVLRKHLRQYFHKYSGVVLDIYYDHFLALHWEQYADIKLENYVSEVYLMCLRNYDQLPLKTRYIMPYMISGNWLYNYANYRGLYNVFEGMARRTTFESGMQNSVDVLKKEYQMIQTGFEAFFPELADYVFSNQLYTKYAR